LHASPSELCMPNWIAVNARARACAVSHNRVVYARDAATRRDARSPISINWYALLLARAARARVLVWSTAWTRLTILRGARSCVLCHSCLKGILGRVLINFFRREIEWNSRARARALGFILISRVKGIPRVRVEIRSTRRASRISHVCWEWHHWRKMSSSSSSSSSRIMSCILSSVSVFLWCWRPIFASTFWKLSRWFKRCLVLVNFLWF